MAPITIGLQYLLTCRFFKACIQFTFCSSASMRTRQANTLIQLAVHLRIILKLLRSCYNQSIQMSQQINQLCKDIALHPSTINQLNQAIMQALNQPNAASFRPIVELLASMDHLPQIAKFRDNKIHIVFRCLIELCIEEPDSELVQLIQKVFSISNQKDALAQKFVNLLSSREIQWLEWPTNLLTCAFESLTERSLTVNDSSLTFVSSLIIKLPHFNELKIPQDLQNSFKRSFQKLLISTLSNPSITRQLLHDIYHNLGERVFSKLQNPLILANHCIEKFANDSELQIEALSCIFLLVGKYGLDLQEFYPKLEKLVRQRKNGYSIYELPNSRRFFKLLEASLRSSRVPFKTISTFASILIRQIAGEDSEFAFWSLSFIVNLTKKHRKLLDEIPSISELKILKHHYNPKIRALVQQLSKNMNKTDYLEIDEFSSIKFSALCEAKMQSLMGSLANEDLQFKIPAFEDPI